MPARSAGILLYRRMTCAFEVLLVHPGGPFWRNRDVGAWQLPKGLVEPGEGDEAAARREVAEELGIEVATRWSRLGRYARLAVRRSSRTPLSATSTRA